MIMHMLILKFIYGTIIPNQTLESSVRLQGCEIPIRWRTSDRFYNNISFKALFERFNLTNFY